MAPPLNGIQTPNTGGRVRIELLWRLSSSVLQQPSRKKQTNGAYHGCQGSRRNIRHWLCSGMKLVHDVAGRFIVCGASPKPAHRRVGKLYHVHCEAEGKKGAMIQIE
eukprot:GHVT01018867.1.p1 GENE.GHVT01018867.1~~GHVT01018867.1.p1  ORF type:complete len:107 (-),score=20.08 GHVT01018867.1:8-328(-)